jgi:hypothetical protein
MSSAKWSSKGSRSTIKKGLELMTLDQTLSNATANQLMTVEQLFGAVTTSATTTGVLALPPSIFVYTGAANGARTLPAGSSDIIGLSIRVFNDSSFELTITPNGGDTFTSFFGGIVYPGSFYNFVWTGTKWIII